MAAHALTSTRAPPPKRRPLTALLAALALLACAGSASAATGLTAAQLETLFKQTATYKSMISQLNQLRGRVKTLETANTALNKSLKTVNTTLTSKINKINTAVTSVTNSVKPLVAIRPRLVQVGAPFQPSASAG